MNRLHDLTGTLDRLLEVVVLLNRDMTRTLAREGLTVPRTRVVWFLHHNGPTTQRALADFLDVTPRNVTGLVDGLAAAGFVKREPHPADRRAILVSLTEHGSASMAAMDRSHKELAELLFGDMPQVDAFGAGLDHVLERLREELKR